MKIIFDTNMLIYCVKYKIDIAKQLRGNEFFLLDSVLAELKKISTGKGKKAELAKIVLQLIKNFKKIKHEAKTAASVDSLLFELGKKGYVIATQDTELQKRLKAAGARYIYLRQKKYFEGICFNHIERC